MVDALRKVDDNILKLDSAFSKTVAIMNCPVGHFNLKQVVEQLAVFKGKVTIQTMFLKGEFNGEFFDNTTDIEVDAWINLIKIIQPERVMIYSIARDTPLQSLEQIEADKLYEIASKLRGQITGEVEVSG